MPNRLKVVIDTDPGVDDAMAILAMLNSPEVEVLALTTLFGNVPTHLATENALRLVEMAGRPEVLVVPGATKSLEGEGKERIADFVHGQDGFGNTHLPPPKGQPAAMSAAEYLVHIINQHPGQVTVLALAALTNVALALQLDPGLGGKWARLVVLGGAYFVNGNVNPAAEANLYGDPHAAEVVLGSSENIQVVGLDVTEQCCLTSAQLDSLQGRGRHGSFVHQIAQFYLQYHQRAFNKDAIHLHDPAAMVAVLRPDLFGWRRGAVCVVTEGPAKGHTILDAGHKAWVGTNEWLTRPKVEVALAVDSEAVVQLVLQRLGV